MPFVDLPSRGLRQYYTINPHYAEGNLDMDLEAPAPPSKDSLDPNKPILVFNHAGTSSSQSFIYQFRDARLSEALNLVAFDTRYYGRTSGDRLDHFQDLEERADELLDAIDAVVGDKPFSYFGESFVGSHVGAYMAAKRPEQVKALILISPSCITDSDELCEILETQWRPLCESNKFGKGDGTGALPDYAIQIALDYFFSGVTHVMDRQDAFARQYQWHHGPGRDMWNIDQLLFWFRRKSPSPETFAAIRCPVLLMRGSRDLTVNPPEALTQWSEALVNVAEEDKHEEHIIDGGHFLATTDANRVNRVALAFLKRYKLA
ncbi:hypothetical protein JCM11251_002371 [Rhodosporidiobolus azoricus]